MLYPTDLTDRQWRRMEPWIPVDAATGRPSTYAKREIVNAILLYVTRNGCTWRAQAGVYCCSSVDSRLRGSLLWRAISSKLALADVAR